MFVDGAQLPFGPDTSNLGGTVDTDPMAVSGLDIGTYSISSADGGGADMISPTLAIKNGVVATPTVNTIAQYSALVLGGSAPYDNPRGDYATDGSLTSIRNQAGRGMGLDANLDRLNKGCVPGDSLAALGINSALDNSVSPSSNWLLWAALALVVVGLSDSKGSRSTGARRARGSKN